MGHLTGEDLPLDRTSLVVAQHFLAATGEQHRACFDADEFGEYNVLRVVYADSPVSLFDWAAEYGTRPFFGRIVVASRPEAVEGVDPPRDDVGSVMSNRNLNRLGATITTAIESMNDANDRPVHLCFEGVETLVEVTGESDTFQFLRLTIEMIHETDHAGGHFHLDPSDTSKEQRLTVEQLFEHVNDMDRRHDRARDTTGATTELDY